MILSWDITRHCNLACKHCSNAFQRSEAGPDLSTGEALRLIRSLPTPPIKLVRILGGEPFLREDLLTIIGEILARGLEVSITTNGQFAEPSILECLVEQGVSKIILSIGGDSHAHEAIRGAGTFRKVEKFLTALKDARKDATKPQIQTNVILQRDNHLRMPPLFQWLKKHPEIDHSHFGQIEPLGRSVPNNTLLTLNEMERSARSIIENRTIITQSISLELPEVLANRLNQEYGVNLAATKSGCAGGVSELRLFSDGRLYPCHLGELIAERLSKKQIIHFTDTDTSLRHHSFVDIYNGHLFKEFFRWLHGEAAHYDGDNRMPKCPFTVEVPIFGTQDFYDPIQE